MPHALPLTHVRHGTPTHTPHPTHTHTLTLHLDLALQAVGTPVEQLPGRCLADLAVAMGSDTATCSQALQVANAMLVAARAMSDRQQHLGSQPQQRQQHPGSQPDTARAMSRDCGSAMGCLLVHTQPAVRRATLQLLVRVARVGGQETIGTLCQRGCSLQLLAGLRVGAGGELAQSMAFLRMILETTPPLRQLLVDEGAIDVLVGLMHSAVAAEVRPDVQACLLQLANDQASVVSG